MKSFFSILTLALLFLPYAHSQESSNLGMELVRIMKMEEQLKLSLNVAGQSQVDMIRKMFPQNSSPNLTPEQKALTEQFSAKMMSDVMEFMTKELDLNDYVKKTAAIYDNLFTQDELKQMIAFYQSPAGQKMVQKTPEIMVQSMEIMQEQMMRIIPKLQIFTKERAEQFQKDLKALQTPKTLQN